MQFQHEKLVDREIEIAGYLQQDFSIKQVCEKTGLSKKLLEAHIQNMMEKLKAADITALKNILKIINTNK